MITVKVTKKENVYRAVSEGHAEDPEVCAAMTCLLNTLRGSIENMTESGKKKYKVESGKFNIKYIPENIYDDATAGVIFNGLIIGVLQLQETYPGEIAVVK